MRNLLIALAALALAACGPDNNTNTTPDNSANSGMNNPDNSTMNNGMNNPDNSANSGMNNPDNSTMNSGTTNNGSTNNGSTNNGSTNNGSTNNGSTNNSSTNNATNNGSTNNATNNNSGADVTEMEPNDGSDAANAIAVGNTVAGTADGADVDVFSFDGTAGSVIEIEVISTNATLTQVDLIVYDDAQDVPERYMPVIPNQKRQFFLPNDGTWYIDLTSQSQDAHPYTLAVRNITPSPSSQDFAASVMDDLDDGAVDIYELPDIDGAALFSLEADRLDPPSDLDSILIVYNPNAGAVAVNDDADMTTYDSDVEFTGTAGETYWLVVDAYEIGSTNAYELTGVLP